MTGTILAAAAGVIGVELGAQAQEGANFSGTWMMGDPD
jgi:hypothetical protein